MNDDRSIFLRRPLSRSPDPQRRSLCRTLAAAGALGTLDHAWRSCAWAAGSDAPELAEVRIGFLPLTDCASVVVAASMGFDRKHGVRILPSKETSFALVRDKLIAGELQLSQMLCGQVYGVQLGIGGVQHDMAHLMTLNQNGQAVTLSRLLAQRGVRDGTSLATLMRRERREYVFAQTFPTGTHAMWLYYWLAAHGIHPLRDARSVSVPGPQMVANLRVGNMDGFCAGEPWNARAVADEVGFTVVTSQAIWKGHPEKSLAATADFVHRHPNTCRAVVSALLEASRFIDASADNRRRTAGLVAARAYVNTDEAIIVDRMLGRYSDGLGRTWDDPDPMRFFDGGAVNVPYPSDGMWFLTQFKRWGLLKAHPEYAAVAQKVSRLDVYRQAAAAAAVPMPAGEWRPATLIDGVRWDPSRPVEYADGFEVRA